MARMHMDDPAVQAAIAQQQSPTGPAQGSPLGGGLPGDASGEAPPAPMGMPPAPMGAGPPPMPPVPPASPSGGAYGPSKIKPLKASVSQKNP